MEAENIDFDEGIEQVESQPEVEQEVVQEVEQETTQEASDEQTEPEAKEERHQITFTEEQQQFINENIVGKKVAKMREVERHAEELQRRLEEIEASVPKASNEPQIPPMPDPWDSDFDGKVKQRDEAILARARWEEGERVKQEQQVYQQQMQEESQRKELYERVGTYSERAKKMGISDQELQVAGNAVSQFLQAKDNQDEVAQVVDFMLLDEHGPGMTMYLAKNMQELQIVQNMNPLQAAAYLATEIKPRVIKNMKRKAPPEPTESVKGSGLPEKEKGPKGATFE